MNKIKQIISDFKIIRSMNKKHINELYSLTFFLIIIPIPVAVYAHMWYLLILTGCVPVLWITTYKAHSTKIRGVEEEVKQLAINCARLLKHQKLLNSFNKTY